ncbi:MAG: bifunctional 4-hydroxy-2-oxoglutarate aldolase/2-dehydro-3-deoxy-phosphogluconate aldolase [Firmicutes bacterium]|nr:bifunctional 4-hydroxy-2-oxoglutarate aldolase/2-dehydro-3-deoxy-phosphogluconate aldolase [Bacillota bacterium]
MNETLKLISNTGILPVIAIDDAEKAVPLAKALLKGGIAAAEFTFRTEAAEEAIRAVANEVPEILVGAGTVLTPDQLDRALKAGARFIVTPGFNPELVRYGLSKGALMLPGTATPGEMEQAMALGLEAVKFFPAEDSGGIKKLRSLAGPYRDLKWVPTGGINPKNLGEYLSFDQVLACGGTWMVRKDLIESESWDEITALCKEAVDIMLGFKLSHVGVNTGSAEEAENMAKLVCSLFGGSPRELPKAWFAGDAVEFMKGGGRGAKGHIGFKTNNVERAMHYLGQKGIEFIPESVVRNEKGEPTLAYLKGEFAGFAVHIANK